MSLTNSELYAAYRKAGLLAFPLSAGSKVPKSGTNLKAALDMPFAEGDNIGVFAGGETMLAFLDADDERSQKNATWFFKNRLPIYDRLTIVRTPTRGGLHFWIRVARPADIQAYYKLPSKVGHGEFRFRRPAYVVAPGSSLPNVGAYEFVQGGLSELLYQPVLAYKEILPLLPPHAESPQKFDFDDSAILDIHSVLGDIAKQRSPKILGLVQLIHSRSTNIPKLDRFSGRPINKSYSSRSEAEAGLVYGLIRSGWEFDEVFDLFKKERLEHFSSVPQPRKYLAATYAKMLQFAGTQYKDMT